MIRSQAGWQKAKHAKRGLLFFPNENREFLERPPARHATRSLTYVGTINENLKNSNAALSFEERKRERRGQGGCCWGEGRVERFLSCGGESYTEEAAAAVISFTAGGGNAAGG